MIRIDRLIGFLLLTVILYSCNVRDGEDPCPEGDVKLRLYVERFQNKSEDPLSEVETNFYDRVNHVRYFIYKDGELIKNEIVNTFTRAASDHYLLDLPKLEFGKYKVAIVVNCTKEALSGDPILIDNLLLTFPGCKDTEDYFTNTFDFEVNSTELKEYNVGLLRTQGVVRYSFQNLPEDASDVEVIMHNVNSEKWISGDYATACMADHRYAMIPVTRAETEDYVMGTFPTMTDGRSTLNVNLYRTGEESAYVTQLVSDTLTVKRNQLLDIVLTYNNGQFDYEILLDTTWDGSSSGEVGIQ